MKKTLISCALLAATLPAGATFSGLTDPSNWTSAVSGGLMGTVNSFFDVFHDLDVLSMRGADASDGCDGGVYGDITSPCSVLVSIPLSGTFSFDWDYATSDADGPEGDIFGVMVDGVPMALRDPGGAINQQGGNSFYAGSSFGFFINCTDCLGGPASVRIGNFNFVPEPAPLALLAAASLGLAWRRRQPKPR